MIPADHRYLVNGGENVLNKRTKVKFNNPNDRPNEIRAFHIRENALKAAVPRNPTVKQMLGALSEENRRLAVKAIQTPVVNKTLDQIFEERPELASGETIKIVTATIYKKL